MYIYTEAQSSLGGAGAWLTNFTPDLLEPPKSVLTLE